MRTPGSDFELAAGFLFSEGVVRDKTAILRIDYCSDVDADQLYNVVSVHISGAQAVDLEPLERHFFTSSSCGVCGKAGIDAIETRGVGQVQDGQVVSSTVISALPDALRAAQKIFESTGGLHGAGLFTVDGELSAVREDVGRHNAVDKLLGWALLDNRTPLADSILVVSGRVSFEIVQKAAVAGIPMICAVSAPTNLAVSTAERFGITLIGFLRDARFNVYSGTERVQVESSKS